MNSALLFFIIITIINVFTYTAKTIITVKGSKLSAAAINAINSVMYILLVIYAVTDINIWIKLLITALCNFFGVYAIKFIEAKMRKDKLWKIEVTVDSADFYNVKTSLETKNIPFNYIDVRKYVIFNIYCATQIESRIVKELLDHYDVKYFVSETENLI